MQRRHPFCQRRNRLGRQRHGKDTSQDTRRWPSLGGLKTRTPFAQTNKPDHAARRQRILLHIFAPGRSRFHLSSTLSISLLLTFASPASTAPTSLYSSCSASLRQLPLDSIKPKAASPCFRLRPFSCRLSMALVHKGATFATPVHERAHEQCCKQIFRSEGCGLENATHQQQQQQLYCSVSCFASGRISKRGLDEPRVCVCVCARAFSLAIRRIRGRNA